MSALPHGFAVRLSPTVRIRDGGRTLVGGAPLRVSHLNEKASALLSGSELVVSDPVSALLADRLLGSGMAEPVIDKLDDIDLREVTCVIPVKDPADSLSRLLTGLIGLGEVIVVDNCSEDADRVAETVAAAGATVVQLEQELGPAGARNAGLRLVSTPYVLFADSDAVVDSGAVAVLLRHLHDPRVAVVAPRIRSLERSANWISRYESARSSLDRGDRSALVLPGSAVSWVPSACLLARVSAIGAGFDTTMPVGEDVDFVWRVTDEGWRVRYESGVTVRHAHRTSLMPWLRRKAYFGSGADVLAARHGRKISPAVVSPLDAAMAATLLAQRRWSAPVAAVLAGVLTTRRSRALRRIDRPIPLAAELTALDVSATLSRSMTLMLRHWWPLAVMASAFSRRVRRALLVCALTDAVTEYVRASPDMGPLSFAVARRLDDMAYGAGLWSGAIRSRSLKALLPDVRLGPET